MSEWWTYSFSDFLLFSPRTYHRLFELYNTALWPMHLAALLLGMALLVAAWRGWARAGRAMLAACWLWVAWAFLWQRYATINWAAPWFAIAFAIEGVLLLLASVFASAPDADAPDRGRRLAGLGLLLLALFVLPSLGVLQGRPWVQAEVFGMAPDPTAAGTLGALLLLPAHRGWKWLLWPVPLFWCALGMATAWTMHANG
ncbi:DUF6064 family protein [Variovorax sp. OV329]|uniref:DUF6064 family protein n=1 Tax=Variovorax sp. OV329 TaxID=1882825 RepID=UPI0008EFD8C8|nr:DUF6064 family protein [Variovorax sp. OV329]SFL87209.1 hypothetical protein SAMN05444747_10163 [Variovorax sp. OV329]